MSRVSVLAVPSPAPGQGQAQGQGTDPAEETVRRLVVLAANFTGVSAGSIHPENVRRAMRPLLARGMTDPELLAGAQIGQADIVDALRRSVSIGETYFFRYPHQFQFLRSTIAPALFANADSNAACVRVWSAGCATGEETYSLAALFRELSPSDHPRIDVLGTDHLDKHVERARAGVYRDWSMRASAPILSPLFDRTADGAVRIRDDVRALTRFQVHNLLTPPPGSFDLIFCRNVLIYYEGDAIRTILGALASALAPGGVLVLGVVDPPSPPPGLQVWGSPELRVYRRNVASVPGRPTSSAPATPRRPRIAPAVSVDRIAQPAAPASDSLRLHLQALGLIEQGHHREAALLLDQILAVAPGTVAARLERALLHQRFGEPGAMSICARGVLEGIAGLADEIVVPGPEVLPVSYYRSSAEALLLTVPRRRV